MRIARKRLGSRNPNRIAAHRCHVAELLALGEYSTRYENGMEITEHITQKWRRLEFMNRITPHMDWYVLWGRKVERLPWPATRQLFSPPPIDSATCDACGKFMVFPDFYYHWCDAMQKEWERINP